MELRTIAILSTSHLTIEVDQLFQKKIEIENEYLDNWENEDLDNWIDIFTWGEVNYGYVLNISSENFDPESEYYHTIKNIPECILNVADYCRKRGASWVLFDRDAQAAEGLKTYNW